MIDSTLFWIDRITDPWFFTTFSIAITLFVSLDIAGLVGLVWGNKKLTRRVWLVSAILIFLAVFGLLFALWVWYNTPMGEPLNLKNPPLRW